MGVVDGFVDWAHSCLLDSEEAVSYLTRRGSSPDQWERHRIGYIAGDYAPDSSSDPSHNIGCADRDKRTGWCDTCRYRRWSSVWESDEEGAPKTQIVGRRHVGCVVYPLTSYSGTVVGFQTRSVKEKDYDSFTTLRRPEGYFFGLAPNVSRIFASGDAWFVEGPSDQLVVERLVDPRTVAITTNSLTKQQSLFVRRYVRRAFLCLDLDGAGRDGTKDFIESFSPGVEVIDVKYPRIDPKDKDPGDLWKAVGDARFPKMFRL